VEISKPIKISLSELDFLKVERFNGFNQSILIKKNSNSYIFYPFEHESRRKVSLGIKNEKKLEEFLKFRIPELFTEGNRKN
jgi:hypothetical protein